MQQLPTEDAERLLKATKELERLRLSDIEHCQKADKIRTWSWIAGIIGLIILNSTLGRAFNTPTVIAIDVLFVGAVWLLSSLRIRKEYKLANKATMDRLQLEDDVFRPLGIEFNDKIGRVRSLEEISDRQKVLQDGLRQSHAAYLEIVAGANLAMEKGLSPQLLEHRAWLLSPVLGGLPTEELLHHPDCERLFREMSAIGLREKTVEAILLQFQDRGLPLTSSTLNIARRRLASAQSA
jgi:hypothetical protein